jgi:hypothetical protein
MPRRLVSTTELHAQLLENEPNQVEAEESASMRRFVMVMGRYGENMDAWRRHFGGGDANRPEITGLGLQAHGINR